MALVFCRNCGNKIPDSANFCTRCGAAVAVVAPVVPVDVPAPVPPSAPSAPAAPDAAGSVAGDAPLPPPLPRQVDEYGFPLGHGMRPGAKTESGSRATLPMPPRLHWALVFLFGLMTCGIFLVVWYFVQAGYARRVDEKSNARGYLLVFLFAYLAMLVVSAYARGVDDSGALLVLLGMQAVFALLYLVFFFCAVFSMAESLRKTMQRHGLRSEIGGITLFFFSVFYLQGQLSWLARWKESGQTQPSPPKAVFWWLAGAVFALSLLAGLIVGTGGASLGQFGAGQGRTEASARATGAMPAPGRGDAAVAGTAPATPTRCELILQAETETRRQCDGGNFGACREIAGMVAARMMEGCAQEAAPVASEAQSSAAEQAQPVAAAPEVASGPVQIRARWDYVDASRQESDEGEHLCFSSLDIQSSGSDPRLQRYGGLCVSNVGEAAGILGVGGRERRQGCRYSARGSAIVTVDDLRELPADEMFDERLEAALVAVHSTRLIEPLSEQCGYGEEADDGSAAEATSVPPAAGPSYSCGGSLSRSEAAICASAQLSELDRRIADGYAAALAARSGASRSALVSGQRNWLNRRESDCGGNAACLQAMMQARAAELAGSGR